MFIDMDNREKGFVMAAVIDKMEKQKKALKKVNKK